MWKQQLAAGWVQLGQKAGKGNHRRYLVLPWDYR